MEKIISSLISYYGFKNISTNREYINFSCPFHVDRMPSCGINSTTGHWHCFSCADGGNIVNFVYRIEKNYDRAKKILKDCGYCGEEDDFVRYIENILDSECVDVKESEEMLYTFDKRLINDYDKEFEYYNLRGIDNQTCEYFNLRSSKNWRIFDKTEQKHILTHRAIIPIYTETDNLVGFVTRAIDNSLPKYWNTPGLKRFLFNINNIYKNVNDINEIIVVEGIFDALKIYQSGFKNVVAILGNEMSEFQFESINKITNNIVIAFDNDEHGKNITEKAISNFGSLCDIYIVDLNFHKDFGEIDNNEEILEIINNKQYYLEKYCVWV